MLLRVMKNSALSAKVHAMSGTTLHRADYDALMQLHSVPEVASYLSENTRYCHALKSFPITTLHRGKLEQLLKSQISRDILSLLHYTDMDSTFFLKVLEMQDEVEKLKIFLRLLHIGHPEQITEQVVDLPVGNSPIQASALAQLTDFSAFMDYLKPTPFYRVFRSFEGDFRRQELFYLEIALDVYWAKLIHRYAKKYLNREEAGIALKVYGTEIDLDNLVFILRCKERFQMTDQEIYTCIIPSYYRLSESLITEIVNSTSLEQALEIIQKNTPYADAFHPEDRFFEKRKNDYLMRLHRRVYTNHPYSIQAAISYVYLRRIEINNIVSIIEGIRYGLKPEEIRQYLIGYGKGDAET